MKARASLARAAPARILGAARDGLRKGQSPAAGVSVSSADPALEAEGAGPGSAAAGEG
jgi:hypothetical protein